MFVKGRKFNFRVVVVWTGIFLFLVFQFVIIRRIYIKNASKDLNLLLISVDTLRADHMGVYGYPKNTTPNIDAWAKDAFVFTNMRTMVPVTYPSFATLMTGKSPFETGIYNNGVVDGKVNPGAPLASHTTLAQMLQKYGYNTAAFVTTDALDGKYTNLNKGFDSYRLGSRGWGEENFGQYFSEDRVDYEKFVENSLLWLSENKDKKFFLWIHLMDPHAPYAPPSDLQCKFNIKFCREIYETGLVELERERANSDECQPFRVPESRIELFQTLYDGAIAYSDHLVGKILERLTTLGLDEKTLVVLYGDHGEGFDHSFYFSHSHVLYDSHLRTPFIIKHPLISPPGRIVDSSIDNSQFFPTIVELLNVSTTAQNNNRSFSTLLYGGLSSKLYRPKPYIFSVNAALSKYAIQDGRFKYIYSIPERSCPLDKQVEELYDLKKDPQETVNLVQKKPEIAEKLRSSLLKHLSRYALPKSMEILEGEELSPEQKRIIEKLKSLGY